MTAKLFTKSQARNNKKFRARLDKVTGWLVDGDWHGSYRSTTEGEDDGIIFNVANQEQLAAFTFEFVRLPGGGLKAIETRVEPGGGVVQESFIVGVQPYDKSFYMVSLDDNDLAFGSIRRGSNTMTITKLEESEPPDGSFVGVFQLTDLMA